MSMRKVFLIAAAWMVGLLASACIPTPNPQPPGLTPIPSLAPAATVTLLPAIQAGAPGVPSGGPAQGVAALGAPVFLKNCSVCHGNQAEGISGLGPALRNNVLFQGTQTGSAFSLVASGVPDTQMPAWLVSNGGKLTSDEINNVIAYLGTLQDVSPIPTLPPAPEEATETPLPANAPTPEPARPSNSGNPGPAASLSGDAGRGQAAFGQFCAACHGPEGIGNIPNPGSEDGTVPPLNPIDSTMVSKDAKIFGTNVDLFIEHGSVPDGEAPLIIMPAFGDQQMLTGQQIADIIAYVLQLNPTH